MEFGNGSVLICIIYFWLAREFDYHYFFPVIFVDCKDIYDLSAHVVIDFLEPSIVFTVSSAPTLESRLSSTTRGKKPIADPILFI